MYQCRSHWLRFSRLLAAGLSYRFILWLLSPGQTLLEYGQSIAEQSRGCQIWISQCCRHECQNKLTAARKDGKRLRLTLLLFLFITSQTTDIASQATILRSSMPSSRKFLVPDARRRAPSFIRYCQVERRHATSGHSSLPRYKKSIRCRIMLELGRCHSPLCRRGACRCLSSPTSRPKPVPTTIAVYTTVTITVAPVKTACPSPAVYTHPAAPAAPAETKPADAIQQIGDGQIQNPASPGAASLAKPAAYPAKPTNGTGYAKPTSPATPETYTGAASKASIVSFGAAF
ncbi:uncharacterized protein MYCGRDRAFT_96946 [Zymoseptoria tritici IPO323]|uniref:Uncharacterized protein n=1 Tax=Zymoseptoria tritici (strain CBS 115943 / IPO323) TaxID=336722 RepID=F9XNE5_ZYMTI|nr:uncharacterized protein MYCGRDRAFT_96946 [Zymoseptoria tritici IPO323]EGP83179.1 hypothetical protein MYCGRDRAFT_96946 [Zymoseptoria tritici IPO323]